VIPWLNNCAAAWFNWMAAMLWQSAILIAIVWTADLLLRRFAWPQFRYILWLLIFVKLLLPPGFALPTSITSRLAVIQHSIHGDIAKPSHLSSNGLAVQAPIEIAQAKMSPSSSRTIEPSLSWQSKLMLVWLTGIMVFAFWLYLRLRHLRINRSQSGLPEWLPSILQECADKLSIQRAPSIAITTALKCPAVFGIFQPTILIPREGIAWLEKKQACNILLHELTHIKRGDLFLHAIQIALQILYWPNVLLWLIRRPMHDLRELCCDADVASVLRENTPSYRQTLLDAARRLITEPSNPGLGLLGLFEQPHAIVTRLKYLEKPYGRQTLCKYISVFIALVMVIFVLPMSPMRAGTGNQEKPSLEVAKLNKTPGDQENPRFEVISIKRRLNPNESGYGDYAFLPGGRLRIINNSLRGLIANAYEIPVLQIVGIPDSIKKYTWDVEATPDEGKYPLKNGLIDPKIGDLMVQSMLEDRFKLKVHRETKSLPGYKLVVVKGGANLRASEKRAEPYTCAIWRGHLDFQSKTLSDFADFLSLVLSTTPIADVHGPLVVDNTGIKGLYDFKLHWTPDDAKASVESQNHSDEDSRISFFDAIQEQLGLKLVPTKLPTPVVVVDAVRMPTN
jgi:bla regulator protein blaR1